MSKILSIDNVANMMNLYDCQEYIPIYDLLNNEKLFRFNNENITINNCSNYNVLECEENKEELNIFCKFAPIVNYTKYLAGKLENENLNILPSLQCENGVCCEKMMQKHNAAYVDCLFYYLTHICKKDDHFIHGLDFYGSFLCINKNYKINISDDMDVLIESDYFHENIDKKYTLDNIEDVFFDNNSGKNKISLNLMDAKIELEEFVIEDLNNMPCDLNNYNRENSEKDIKLVTTEEMKLEGEIKINESDDSDNSNSSNTVDDDDELSGSFGMCNNNDNESLIMSGSDCTDLYPLKDDESLQSYGSKAAEDYFDSEHDNTLPESLSDKENEADDEKNDEDDDDEDEDEDEEDDDDEDEDDDESECNIIANIYNFPVQAILLENCDETLEEYMLTNDELSIEEWKSILIQIIMTLYYYQEKYSFTHNDLHTGNIMYKTTTKEFLYYKVKDKLFKVPTFGKIYKIIDFGRAIFTYNDTIFCSDAFSRGEDADTQYNCDPFFNDKKPRIEPNYSFDLCRLGCSLFDFFIEAMEEIDELVETNPIIALIVEWCQDDNFKSVLYRKNGEERYPEFKLYKMIARNVHRHIPEIQLKKEIFSIYIIENNDIKNEDIMNIV